MHWRFVATTLAGIVVLLGAVAAFNAYVDTTGMLGTGKVDPLAALPRDRAAKVALLQKVDNPQVVVLGSSRSKRLRADEVLPDTTRGVNAAAVGADQLEARVMAAWMADRTSEARPFPHLVVGVDVEQFRGSSLRESGMLAVPAIADVARREARDSNDGALLPLLDDLLLTWDATHTSVDALRTRDEREREAARAAQDPNEVTRTQPVDEFDQHGMLRSDARFAKESFRRSVADGLPREVALTVSDYNARYASMGSELDADAVTDFTEMVDIANEQGDEPLVYLTPMHPSMQSAMQVHGREQRRAALVELLEELAADGRITFIDCSAACVPENPLLWSDGVHLTPLGAQRLARELHVRLARATQSR
jgi:hypothetical protein